MTYLSFKNNMFNNKKLFHFVNDAVSVGFYLIRQAGTRTVNLIYTSGSVL